jgi:uncharacterized protein (TIGR02996 family)
VTELTNSPPFVGGDYAALLAAVLAHPRDDTPFLVAADWLDDAAASAHAARIRWWVTTRSAAAGSVTWDQPRSEWRAVERAIGLLPAKYYRLAGVLTYRVVLDRFPLPPEYAAGLVVCETAVAAAELHALGLTAAADLASASTGCESAADAIPRGPSALREVMRAVGYLVGSGASPHTITRSASRLANAVVEGMGSTPGNPAYLATRSAARALAHALAESKPPP